MKHFAAKKSSVYAAGILSLQDLNWQTSIEGAKGRLLNLGPLLTKLPIPVSVKSNQQHIPSIYTVTVYDTYTFPLDDGM